MLAFLALWLGYMSITSIGQTFYGFGWEMLLLEAGFLAAFLGSHDPPPTVVIVLLPSSVEDRIVVMDQTSPADNADESRQSLRLPALSSS